MKVVNVKSSPPKIVYFDDSVFDYLFPKIYAETEQYKLLKKIAFTFANWHTSEAERVIFIKRVYRKNEKNPNHYTCFYSTICSRHAQAEFTPNEISAPLDILESPDVFPRELISIFNDAYSLDEQNNLDKIKKICINWMWLNDTPPLPLTTPIQIEAPLLITGIEADPDNTGIIEARLNLTSGLINKSLAEINSQIEGFKKHLHEAIELQHSPIHEKINALHQMTDGLTLSKINNDLLQSYARRYINLTLEEFVRAKADLLLQASELASDPILAIQLLQDSFKKRLAAINFGNSIALVSFIKESLAHTLYCAIVKYLREHWIASCNIRSLDERRDERENKRREICAALGDIGFSINDLYDITSIATTLELINSKNFDELEKLLKNILSKCVTPVKIFGLINTHFNAYSSTADILINALMELNAYCKEIIGIDIFISPITKTAISFSPEVTHLASEAQQCTSAQEMVQIFQEMTENIAHIHVNDFIPSDIAAKLKHLEEIYTHAFEDTQRFKRLIASKQQLDNLLEDATRLHEAGDELSIPAATRSIKQLRRTIHSACEALTRLLQLPTNNQIISDLQTKLTFLQSAENTIHQGIDEEESKLHRLTRQMQRNYAELINEVLTPEAVVQEVETNINIASGIFNQIKAKSTELWQLSNEIMQLRTLINKACELPPLFEQTIGYALETPPQLHTLDEMLQTLGPFYEKRIKALNELIQSSQDKVNDLNLSLPIIREHMANYVQIHQQQLISIIQRVQSAKRSDASILYSQVLASVILNFSFWSEQCRFGGTRVVYGDQAYSIPESIGDLVEILLQDEFQPWPENADQAEKLIAALEKQVEDYRKKASLELTKYLYDLILKFKAALNAEGFNQSFQFRNHACLKQIWPPSNVWLTSPLLKTIGLGKQPLISPAIEETPAEREEPPTETRALATSRADGGDEKIAAPAVSPRPSLSPVIRSTGDFWTRRKKMIAATFLIASIAFGVAIITGGLGLIAGGMMGLSIVASTSALVGTVLAVGGFIASLIYSHQAPSEPEEIDVEAQPLLAYRHTINDYATTDSFISIASKTDSEYLTQEFITEEPNTPTVGIASLNSLESTKRITEGFQEHLPSPLSPKKPFAPELATTKVESITPPNIDWDKPILRGRSASDTATPEPASPSLFQTSLERPYLTQLKPTRPRPKAKSKKNIKRFAQIDAPSAEQSPPPATAASNPVSVAANIQPTPTESKRWWGFSS